jgi:hypothetical protein
MQRCSEARENLSGSRSLREASVIEDSRKGEIQIWSCEMLTFDFWLKLSLLVSLWDHCPPPFSWWGILK